MQAEEGTGPPTIAQGVVRRITADVQSAKLDYHRLVLLVAPVDSGKSITLKEVARHVDGRFVNLNLELSQRLLDLDRNQRTLRFSQVLEEVVGRDASTICLSHTEMLFDPAFKQDPIRLLKALSRTRTVVAAWSGRLEGGLLQYAEPRHPEYLRISIGGLRVVKMLTSSMR